MLDVNLVREISLSHIGFSAIFFATEPKIFIDNGKGSKDRYILFPTDFRLALQTYMEAHEENDFLFESRL